MTQHNDDKRYADYVSGKPPRAPDVAETDKASRPAEAERRQQPNGHADEGPLILRRASTVEPENIRWLWRHFLARRKLHLLAGAPGTGKSTITLTIAAILSKGTVWPGHVDGEDPAPRGDVIIWSAEDSVEDTIVPRLMAAGADLDRVHIIEGRPDPDDATGRRRLPFDPSSQADLDRLGQALTAVEKPVAIILDPIMGAMKAGTDSHKSGDVRAGLDPIVQLAERYDLAAIGITHFAKGTQGCAPIDRVLASVAFTAVPRMVFGCIEVADRPGVCRITRVKTNIAPVGGGFEYSLCQMVVEHGYKRIEAQRVDWNADPLVGSPSQLMAVELPADDHQQRRDDAKSWLRDFLLAGPVAAKEVKDAADAHCHSWRTIERAKGELRVESFRDPLPKGPWFWRLPEPPPRRDPHDHEGTSIEPEPAGPAAPVGPAEPPVGDTSAALTAFEIALPRFGIEVPLPNGNGQKVKAVDELYVQAELGQIDKAVTDGVLVSGRPTGGGRLMLWRREDR